MVTNEDIKSLEPKTPYTKQNGRRFRKPCRNQIPGMRWENKKFSFEEKHKLGPYPMNKNVKNLLDAGFPKRAVAGDLAEESTRCQSLLSNVCWDDYKDHWNLLVTCEEYQMNIDIRSFDMERAPLTTNANPKLLSLIVPGLSENRPSLMRGDIIFASFYPNDTSSAPEDREYEGFVHEIQEKQIHVGFNKSLLDRFINEMKFHIRFTFNRHPLRTMFRAIENVPKTGVTWKNLLFPEAQNFPDSSNLPTLTPYNSIINENDKQKIAVANILEGGIPGIPYIIFGPPGTGKTVTMVEAIKQVWKKKEGSRILVSAPSNEAADLLAIRLLDNIPKSEMIRFYAISRDEQSISKKPDNFKAITTFSKFPSSFQDLLDYRIIVVTVVTASKMVSAGFPKNHFSHFFIDEAGQATEPETLIPISGLLDPEKGQLILAGDPKQLGPIIRSPIALQYGLEVSLLERLMSRDCYKPTNSNLYNSRCITKLCENYRSHPKLLELPSKLFYDSQLVAKGNEALINAMVNWENLPNIGFPMIFHGVIGVDKREEKSPSFFNLEEASIVVDYVQKLLEGRQRGMQKIEPKDIGIISPYRKQVIKIKEMMKKKFPRTFPNWNEMTVGSTEMFQGQERKIIIISTVRSQVELLRDDFTFKLGFLQNPKRFNVAITRMKALLIIVGNPILLSVDPHWKELVKFAKENGGYKGQHFDDGGLREMLQKFNALNLDRNTITSLSLAPEILQDLSQNEASEEAPWDNDKI